MHPDRASSESRPGSQPVAETCPQPPLILAADDEPDMLALVSNALNGGGFRVVTAADGLIALEVARERLPALAILDLVMPGLTGVEVCRMLRGDARTAGIAILILTAGGNEADRISAFERGADDFVTKPFSPRELVLRIKAILRSLAVARAPGPALAVGHINLDRHQNRVEVRRRRVDLTDTEFKLLGALMEAGGRVQSRETLLRRGWDETAGVEIRTVDTQIRRLRAKLAEASEQLQTVRGFGYRLVDRSAADPC